MKYGTRTHMGASLELGVAKALPVHMRGQILEISDVYTRPEFRRQGYASELLSSVTLEADLAGKTLLLAVGDGLIGGADRQGLIDLYGRHAFIQIQADPLLMARPPISMRLAQPCGAIPHKAEAGGGLHPSPCGDRHAH